jgi:hypothetical protein
MASSTYKDMDIFIVLSIIVSCPFQDGHSDRKFDSVDILDEVKF